MSDFELDKAHNAYFECGKQVSTAALQFVSLLTVTLLIAFAVETKEKLGTPIPYIQLEQWPAASILAALTGGAWYRFTAFVSYERILFFKVHSLYKNFRGRELLPPLPWYLGFPSLFDFGDLSANLSSVGKAFRTIQALLFLGFAYLLLPATMVFRIGTKTGYSKLWLVSLGICIVFLVLGAFNLKHLYSWHEAAGILARLEYGSPEHVERLSETLDRVVEKIERTEEELRRSNQN